MKYGFMQLPKAPPIDVEAGEEYPLFNRMLIETHSRCNRQCSFCPHKFGRRNGPNNYMPRATLEKIVGELADYAWHGMIGLFWINEPLLDVAYHEKIAVVRKALPGATITSTTNTDVLLRMPTQLAVKRIAELYAAGLNMLNLNVYDAGEERLLATEKLADEVMLSCGAILAGCGSKYRLYGPRKQVVAVTDMRPDRADVPLTAKLDLRSREDRSARIMLQRHCSRPMRYFVVRWDGAVPLCCVVDGTSPDTPIFGNVNEQSMKSIWNSMLLHRYRYFLQDKRRVLPECDTCTHWHAYPHVHRKIKVNKTTAEQWESEV